MIKKLSFKETVHMQDSVSLRLQMDAVIYRNEYEKYKKEYLEDNSEQKLIFAFIFLQIYLECFLHQNMRDIVALEFQYRDKQLYNEWLKKEEKMFIKDKLLFFTSLFYVKNNEIITLEKNILENFGHITSIRNKLMHGYPLTEDISGNERKKSKTKALLSKSNLTQSIEIANNLSNGWNALLEVIYKKFIALKTIKEFRLELFKIE